MSSPPDSSSVSCSRRVQVLDQVVVVADQRRDPGVVLGGLHRQSRLSGAGVPIIEHARSTSASAAFGDGICEA
jgi:hypothetical protein